MKRPRVGDGVRVTCNLLGHVEEMGRGRVLIRWLRTRGAGEVVREARRRFAIEEVMPAEDVDQAAGVRWRLQYFLDDGRGRQLGATKSPEPHRKRNPWTPWSPTS